jgi:hypothetical protein
LKPLVRRHVRVLEPHTLRRSGKRPAGRSHRRGLRDKGGKKELQNAAAGAAVLERSRHERRASRFSYCNNTFAFLQVRASVDLAGIEPARAAVAGLGLDDRIEILAEGPEIVLRPSR